MIKVASLFSIVFLSSCSLFGIQNEESPNYKVIVKEGEFEVRQYSSYIIAKTTVQGNYDDDSSKAFKILAGYIFGKNKGEKKIAMTSPVVLKEKSIKISMTSPVEMSQIGNSFVMSFSMPSKYTLETLPDPIDNRISFEKVEARMVASHRFSWLSSKIKNDIRAKELRDWLENKKQYITSEGYFYKGYNPPWTLPFLRRNEVSIKINIK